MSNGTVACPQVFPQFSTQAKPLPMLYASPRKVRAENC